MTLFLIGFGVVILCIILLAIISTILETKFDWSDESIIMLLFPGVIASLVAGFMTASHLEQKYAKIEYKVVQYSLASMSKDKNFVISSTIVETSKYKNTVKLGRKYVLYYYDNNNVIKEMEIYPSEAKIYLDRENDPYVNYTLKITSYPEWLESDTSVEDYNYELHVPKNTEIK